MTESPDGTIRIYTQEKGDEAWLYEMHRTGKTWSEPARMELPARRLLKGASFSREDGALYFATDAEMPPPFRGKDLNIWRVEWDGSAWGEAAPIEGDINTGANETIAAVAADGTMIYVSNRPEMDGYGYGLGEAHRDESGVWKGTKFLTDLNDIRTDDHVAVTADGNRMFFYSHRSPGLGGADIWTSTRLADGSWSPPVNPGAPLNSADNEFGPGLSGDGKTLFFSRNGVLMQISLDEVLNSPPLK
jgi:Tol biopolymer transport system component